MNLYYRSNNARLLNIIYSAAKENITDLHNVETEAINSFYSFSLNKTRLPSPNHYKINSNDYPNKNNNSVKSMRSMDKNYK